MTEFDEGLTVKAFVLAAAYGGDVLSSADVQMAWDQPSAVNRMTVGDVAGHMFLVLRRVGKRLEAADSAQPWRTDSPPDEGRSPANAAWLRVTSPDDLDLAEHRRVRDDAAHVAAWGWNDVVAAYGTRLEHVAELLMRGCPADTVIGHSTIPFPAYLATRIVELLTHADDLASSIGSVGGPPKESVGVALQALIDQARITHGDIAVLRALTRPDRAPPNISVF